jgi:protein-S-isoprenylcysteine O-methyltransferase Ste14
MSSIRTPNDSPERTLGQLVADATRDLSSIVRGEIDLAKTEIKADAQRAGKGAGLLAGAGVVAFLGVILLLFAVVYALVAAGLSTWLAFLIVAVVLFVVAAIVGLVGKKALSQVHGKPERTIKSTQATIAAIKPGS